MKGKCLPVFCSSLRPLAFLCGLLLLLGACSTGKPNDEAQPAVEVGTAMPVRQTFHAHVAAFGQLAADSRHALSLSLPQAGEVVATEIIAGRRVQRGTTLLKLATDPATRSAYLQAQSALRVAQADFARTEGMHAAKLATNAQLDAARKTLSDARAALDAQARLGGAQAVVALTAPADGVVTALEVQRGQRVAAGTTLVQFTPASALAAQLGVDPQAASAIRVGMPVAIRPVYAPRDVPPLRGTVAMVGDAVNPQTHLVDLVATPDKPVQLAAGTALSATIDTSDFTAWSVPRNALQNDAQGDFVYQVERGRAKRVDVKVLASDGSPIGVEGALDPHAPVITLGSYEVSDGDPVKTASDHP
ncbi:MAG: efflux RND transporter periplasmic adaptor subunit [Xanthomonadales bacterium]|nr:efflux RND transporter periplasmic adaptor subunit [Xanthomonadales bacterium]